MVFCEINFTFPFQVFLHCVRNQTDGTDQEEQGRTLDDVLKPSTEDNGFTNAGYETSGEPKAVYLHQDSPTTKHRANFQDSAKRSLERYRKTKGKGDLYTINSEQSNLQGSSRSVDRSPDLKGTRMILNKFPTSAEEQEVRIRSEVSRSGSLGDVVAIVNGEPTTAEQKNLNQNEQTPAVHAPSTAPPQRAISNGAAVCDVYDLHEQPPHHHGSKPSVVSAGEAVVVPADCKESQRTSTGQSADRRSSDTSSAGASMVPGTHDSISADVISTRLWDGFL